MEYNRKKVNIIIFVLIFLISLVTIFATVNFVEENDVSQDISVNAEGQQTEKTEDEQINEETQETKLTKAPPFTTGWKALDYAYSVMEQNDYVSTTSTIGKNDPILGIVVTQYANQKKYKSGDECFILDSASSKSSEGTNFTRYTYSDSNNVTVQYAGRAASTISLTDYITKFGFDPSGSYFKLDSTNSKMDSFKPYGASYILKITVNPSVSGVFSNMEKSLLNTPKQIKNPHGISATFEISINKNTGAFEYIKSTERYSLTANSSFGWQSSTITTNSKTTFSWKTTNVSKLKEKYIG